MLGALYANATEPARLVSLGKLYIQSLREIERLSEALRVCVDLKAIEHFPARTEKPSNNLPGKWCSKDLSAEEAENIWKTYSSDPRWSFIHPLVGYQLANYSTTSKNYDGSKDGPGCGHRTLRSNRVWQKAALLLERLNNRFIVKTNKVGVLLPLSGRYGQYGKQALESIKLHFPNSSIELVVRDTVEGRGRNRQCR